MVDHDSNGVLSVPEIDGVVSFDISVLTVAVPGVVVSITRIRDVDAIDSFPAGSVSVYRIS